MRSGVNPYAGSRYYPTVVPVPVPVAKPYYVPKAIVPTATAPNSSVMRAIADANESSAADKVKDQRDVANKMEKLEGQAKINQAINESVKKEEQKVIEAANKRMAEVHSKKAEEANKASAAIDDARAKTKEAIAAAKKEESDAIKAATKSSAASVVA